MGTAGSPYALISRFLRFALVGIFGTAAHYTVLVSLVEVYGVPVLFATTAGFLTGALVNYILNRRFTFASDATHVIALPKFLTVSVLGAVINWLVVAWLLGHVNVHYVVIQLFATGVVLIWNFTANYKWTFRT